MKGGGVTFGPQPKSFEKKVNKKVRELALKSALSEKVIENNIIVVDEFNYETPKTKSVVEFTNKIDAAKTEAMASKSVFLWVVMMSI